MDKVFLSLLFHCYIFCRLYDEPQGVFYYPSTYHYHNIHTPVFLSPSAGDHVIEATEKREYLRDAESQISALEQHHHDHVTGGQEPDSHG